MAIQALLFSLMDFNNQQCHSWMKKHDFIPIKHQHVTGNYRRFRIIEPNTKHKYKTITIQRYPLIKAIYFSN